MSTQRHETLYCMYLKIKRGHSWLFTWKKNPLGVTLLLWSHSLLIFFCRKMWKLCHVDYQHQEQQATEKWERWVTLQQRGDSWCLFSQCKYLHESDCDLLNSQFLACELSVVSALFFVHDDMIWHQFSGTEFHPCKSSHPGPSSCWTTIRNMEPSQLPHTLITALVCGAPCSYPITPQMCPGDAMTHSSWLKRQTTFTSCCWSEVLRSAEVEGGNKHKTFSVCF